MTKYRVLLECDVDLKKDKKKFLESFKEFDYPISSIFVSEVLHWNKKK